MTARCLSIEEALAEELRALSTRTRGRDLYDVWFLFQQGVEVVPVLFEGKMDAVGERPVVRLRISEREWDRDLSVLVEHPPTYGSVHGDVVSGLRDAGIEVMEETD